MASVLISQGNHLTDIALEEAACASPLRAMGGLRVVGVGRGELKGVDGGEEATESESDGETERRGRGRVLGKKLLSGCENAAQPKRLSLE